MKKRWAKVLVGNGRWSCNAIRQTVDGGYISVIGIAIPGQGEEIMLLKLDENGREVWIKKFDTPGDDYPFCVQQTVDRGFIIVGYTESSGEKNTDAWLIKTDENGNEIWNKTFGIKDSYAMFTCIEQTKDGGYIATGHIKVPPRHMVS